MVHIEKDVSPLFVSGTTNLTTANVSKQIISRTDIHPLKGIQFKAGISNGGNIFIGGANVNGTVSNANCGIELEPGDSIFLPVENAGSVYAFNATANDVVHWIVM